MHWGSSKQGYGLGSMLRLTVSMFGLQLAWSTMMVNGTPFLLSLGVSQHMTSLVWFAGPLCGSIVQPLVGSHSDRCTHRWGKRKPYLVYGALGTITSLLGLAYCSEFVPVVARLFNSSPTDSSSTVLVQVVAVAWVYLLNVFLQPLQFGIRTLIIESTPSSQQSDANAWASRFSTAGNAFMCAAGFLDISNWLPFGVDRFHSLALLAAAVLLLTVLVMCLSVSEQCSELYHCDGLEDEHSVFSGLLDAWKNMPELSFKVCRVQFVSWMGWFPMLFYTSSYVGDLYLRGETDSKKTLNANEHDARWHEAVSLGNLSGFVTAIVTLTVLVVVPRTTARFSSANHQRTLTRLWASSQMTFAVTICSTLLVESSLGAILLMAMLGISWAVTTWVPFALLGYDLSDSTDSELAWERIVPRGRGSSDKIRKGGVMGLHNLAIAAPQMISAVLASGLFYILGYFEVADVFGWVIRAGGIPALIAAYMIVQLDVQ